MWLGVNGPLGGETSKVAQSCLTLCDPMDCSPPGSSVHGMLQARILECAAISFSRGSLQPRGQIQVSCIADSLPSEPTGTTTDREGPSKEETRGLEQRMNRRNERRQWGRRHSKCKCPGTEVHSVQGQRGRCKRSRESMWWTCSHWKDVTEDSPQWPSEERTSNIRKPALN